MTTLLRLGGLNTMASLSRPVAACRPVTPVMKAGRPLGRAAPAIAVYRQRQHRVISTRAASAAISPEWSGPTPPGSGDGGSGGAGGSGGSGNDGAGSGGSDQNGDFNKIMLSALGIAATALILNPMPVFARAKADTAKDGKGAAPATQPTRTFSEIAEEVVENAIFSCRFVVFIAVFGTVAMSGLMFVKGAGTLQKALQALLAGKSTEVTMHAIGSLDDFLTGCASLVFGMGLYELFISKLDSADTDDPRNKRGGFRLDHRPNWLHVTSLQHLEHNTGAVVVMVLVVNLFQNSKKMRPTNPLELVYMGTATLLSACAIFVMGAPDRGQGHGGNGDHGAAKDGKKHHDKSEGFSGGWHEQ